MTIRALRRAVKEGSWEIGSIGKVEARTRFQRARLKRAVMIAVLYLRFERQTDEIGDVLLKGKSAGRAEQVIRLGIQKMIEQGWLRPVSQARASSHPAP